MLESKGYDYQSLVAYNESGLHFIRHGVIASQSVFEVACCGLATRGDTLAVGDLAGNVHLVDLPHEQVSTRFAGGGVRSLAWGHDDYLYIGTLEGVLLRVKDDMLMAEPVTELGHTITCLRATPLSLWGGLTDGRIF